MSPYCASLNKLKGKGVYDDCRKALLPFVHCYPHLNPFLRFVESIPEAPPDSSVVKLASAVANDLFYRRSQEASVTQATVHALRLQTGTVNYSSEVQVPDLNAIIDAFGSPEAERACAHVRMELNMLGMFFNKDITSEWARYFWNRGKELVPLNLAFEIPSLPTDPSLHPIQVFPVAYERHCRSCLVEIWSKLPIDVYESETFEVLGALMSRQCNLAVKLCRNPDAWDWHIGPILLRAMTDTYITIAWILKAPLDRARKFISYGLGQEKLQIEHLKAELENVSEPDEKQALAEHIEARLAWVDAQHYSFLQEVDVGSWGGISTRDMAEQAGCMDLYRFAYTPWSHAAHSIWNHIGKFDSRPSSEPLHKKIRQPFYAERSSELDIVVNATKYLDKAFNRVSEEFKLKLELVRPYEWLMTRIDEMQDQAGEMTVSEPRGDNEAKPNSDSSDR